MSYAPKKYTFEAFKKIILADEATQQEYEALETEFSLLAEMLRARRHAQKTQADVAEQMHTSASAISRLESLESWKYHSPTLNTLKKYATAVGCHILIKLEPNADAAC